MQFRVFPPGLWITADDIQGLCGIAAEIPGQAPSHALLFRCHHARGERRGWARMCILSSRYDSLFGALWFDYCWACDFMKTSSCCQLFKLTFLADNLSKLFFLIIVHGLKDSLHSTGDLNNSARKIHQWCAPAAGGGGGESSKSCASSAEI